MFGALGAFWQLNYFRGFSFVATYVVSLVVSVDGEKKCFWKEGSVLIEN